MNLLRFILWRQSWSQVYSPPIALSLATIMDKKVFTDTERENGKSAWLLGLSFISEGAIPSYRR